MRAAFAVIAAFSLAFPAGLIRAAEPARSSQAAQARAYEHDLFSLTLPKGWKVVRQGAEAAPPGGEAAQEAGATARFEDGAGNFFEVVVPCRQPDVAADAFWHCRYDPGSGVTCSEQPPCTKAWQAECLKTAEEVGLGDEDLCPCTAGDGRLSIWATLGGAGSGSACFLFGNGKRETGVDLAVFRDMLRSFRAKPRPPREPDVAE